MAKTARHHHPPNTTRLQRAGALASRVASMRPADPNLRRGLYAAIGIVVVLGVGLAASAALGGLEDVDLHFQPGWLALAVLGFAVLQLVNAALWRALLHRLGADIPALTGTAIWCASALGRYVPTSLLMPLMRIAMADREGVPKRICMASIVYELALAFAGALLVAAYFVIDLPALEGVWERFLVIVLPIVALVALHPAIFHPLADRALVRLGRQPLPVTLPPAAVLRFVALYAATFVFGGTVLLALAAGVYPIEAGDAVVVIGSFAVATVLSLIGFILPGGLAAREAGIVVALAPVMPAGPALAIAVILRIVQLGLEVTLAILVPVLARSRRPAPDRPDGVEEVGSEGVGIR